MLNGVSVLGLAQSSNLGDGHPNRRSEIAGSPCTEADGEPIPG